MATIYVRSSDGSDSDDGSTWALAKATYQAAATAAGTDGIVYMDDPHRETFGTSKTYTIPAGLKTIVAQTDTTTPVTAPNATANLECTTANDDLTISGFFWGISLKTTRYIRPIAAGDIFYFENSRLEQTATAGYLYTYQDGVTVILKDCELKVYGFVAAKGVFNIIGCTYEAPASAPTTLFSVGSEGGLFFIDANDFSAYNGTNIFDFTQLVSGYQMLAVECNNNLMPSGTITWSAGRPTIQTADGWLKCHGNGNGDEYYQIFEDNYGGYVQESVAIYHGSDATYDGTNEFSIGLHGNANTSYVYPIRYKLRIKKVDASSGATIAVHLAYDKATTLNNSDIGLEVKYHDGTNEAHGKWVREIAVGAADPGDRDGMTAVTNTWTESFSNPNAETIEVDIPTGQGVGLVEVWVVLMSNETVYFCSEIEVT